VKHPAHIALLLKSLTQHNQAVTAEENAYRLRFNRDSKLVEVLWPNQGNEVFFDFMNREELLFSESVEYYENETGLQQAEDIARVVQNFLIDEVKVAEAGLLLKRRELQSYRSGKWLSVFEAAAQ
jgi:hypothetical protein